MRRIGVWLVAALLYLSGVGAQAYQQYYDIAQQDQAQAEARERHLPLAWLGSLPAYSNSGEPKALAAQLALTTLQKQAVVILFDSEKTVSVPKLVQAEFQKPDDGPQPKGPNWISPKLVFTDPDATKVIGRVAYIQMSGEGTEAAINSAMQIIRNTKDALEPARNVAGPNAKTSAPSIPYKTPSNHVINYIVILIGIPLAWFIYSRGRDRDAGKK